MVGALVDVFASWRDLRRQEKRELLGVCGISVLVKKVGTGKIGKTHYAIWSADETANVGLDRETPVSSDYDEETSKFTGKIAKVTITVK